MLCGYAKPAGNNLPSRKNPGNWNVLIVEEWSSKGYWPGRCSAPENCEIVGGPKMKRFYFVFCVCVLVLSVTGCPNPTSGSGSGDGSAQVSNGSAPSITDVKVSSNADILHPNFVTTLNIGQTYYIFIYATDNDIDISQCVITYTSGTQTIGPDTIPATNQTAISDIFIGSLTPSTAGKWTATLYLLDTKGNKSNTRSITATVK
jgi:hypothetical protein